MANEVLGYRKTPCKDCGEKAAIMQAKRKGAHLYTRCKCGLDQKTGAAFQLRVWNDALWVGSPPTPPTNIEKKLTENNTGKPVTAGDSGDFDPTEPEPKREPKKEPKGSGGLLGVLFIFAAIGGVAWTVNR